MPNPNPIQSNLSWYKNRVKKSKKELAKAKREREKKARSDEAIIFCKDLDHQLELKAHQLHMHPSDKDARANMGIFMKYKELRDKSSGKSFLDGAA